MRKRETDEEKKVKKVMEKHDWREQKMCQS
jgi:hypothetical protein